MNTTARAGLWTLAYDEDHECVIVCKHVNRHVLRMLEEW